MCLSQKWSNVLWCLQRMLKIKLFKWITRWNNQRKYRKFRGWKHHPDLSIIQNKCSRKWRRKIKNQTRNKKKVVDGDRREGAYYDKGWRSIFTGATQSMSIKAYRFSNSPVVIRKKFKFEKSSSGFVRKNQNSRLKPVFSQ